MQHNSEMISQPTSSTAETEMKTDMNHASPDWMDVEDEPLKWPVLRKIAVSLAASGYAFTLLYGATSYTTGIQGVMKEFDVSMTRAILPFSLYIWGIFFAPMYSPHVSERLGRNIPYFVSTIGLAAFTLGAAYSQSYTQLAVCRFFAGLMGGSNVVQLEGTFADVWPALYTPSYYLFLACAQYFGAATGAIIGWHVVPATDWRWTQYTTLMFALAALLLGAGMPETYKRELIRRRAKRQGRASPLEPALSGTTIGAMAKLTLRDPIIMLFTQPLITMIALYLALNFGVLFSWFISVPAVLQGVAHYTPMQVGSAFATAIGGTAAGAISVALIDQLSVRFLGRNIKGQRVMEVKFRLISAMVGAVLITTSIFWVGWTANPSFKPQIPIIGNGFFVWGSAMNAIGFVSYLFDAFPPQGTLSALTASACMRLAFAGIIPLIIITGIMNLQGSWALSVFGFISVAFLAFPFVIVLFDNRLRKGSRFYDEKQMMNGDGETSNGMDV